MQAAKGFTQIPSEAVSVSDATIFPIYNFIFIDIICTPLTYLDLRGDHRHTGPLTLTATGLFIALKLI